MHSQMENLIITVDDHSGVLNSLWTWNYVFLSKILADDIEKFKTGGTNQSGRFNFV